MFGIVILLLTSRKQRMGAVTFAKNLRPSIKMASHSSTHTTSGGYLAVAQILFKTLLHFVQIAMPGCTTLIGDETLNAWLCVWLRGILIYRHLIYSCPELSDNRLQTPTHS